MCVVNCLGYRALVAKDLILLKNLLMFLNPNVELKHMGNSLCVVTTVCNWIMDS